MRFCFSHYVIPKNRGKGDSNQKTEFYGILTERTREGQKKKWIRKETDRNKT